MSQIEKKQETSPCCLSVVQDPDWHLLFDDYLSLCWLRVHYSFIVLPLIHFLLYHSLIRVTDLTLVTHGPVIVIPVNQTTIIPSCNMSASSVLREYVQKYQKLVVNQPLLLSDVETAVRWLSYLAAGMSYSFVVLFLLIVTQFMFHSLKVQQYPYTVRIFVLISKSTATIEW